MAGILLFLRLIPFSRFAGLLMILVQNTPLVVSIKGKKWRKKIRQSAKNISPGRRGCDCVLPDS